MIACSSPHDQSPDASIAPPIDAPPPPADAAADTAVDAGPSTTLSGVVHNLDDSAVAGATIRFLEAPGLVATTNASGAFTIAVPTDVPLTMRATSATQVPTIEQTVVFHAPTFGQVIKMATPAQYAYIGSFGPSTTQPHGHFKLDLVYPANCSNYDGGHLGTTPATGTVVYAESDQLPNSTYTALQPNAPGGYFIAATGTLTPVVADLPVCAQRAFPVELGNLTVLGPITVEDGAFHDITLFIQ